MKKETKKKTNNIHSTDYTTPCPVSTETGHFNMENIRHEKYSGQNGRCKIVVDY